MAPAGILLPVCYGPKCLRQAVTRARYSFFWLLQDFSRAGAAQVLPYAPEEL